MSLHELVRQNPNNFFFQDDLVDTSAIIENNTAYFCSLGFEFNFKWWIVTVLDNLHEVGEKFLT